MKKINVTITQPNTVSYPMHQHDQWEIMYYLSGKGYMATQNGNIFFEKGSIIIVPPKTMHGSVSEDGFVNISISSDFSHLFMFTEPTKLQENEFGEGRLLASLIFKNRYGNEDYLSALCRAYANYLLQSVTCEAPIKQCIINIIKVIAEKYSDSNFNVTSLLNESGYAEDYIRMEFKRFTQLSPIQFLTKIRIEHAEKLLDIYGKSLSLNEIAKACGFDDVIYFSKKFKRYTGVSPSAYRKNHLV